MERFEDLKGRTLKAISGKVGDEEMVFTLNNDEQCKLYHVQECCESCDIMDINGDLEDLIGSPILLAEEVINEQDINPEGVKIPESQDKSQDSFTWTFYKLSTIKGSVTIRWYGESTGRYSESVTFKSMSN